MITIKKVESKKEMKRFVKFPLKLYKTTPYYVPLFNCDEKQIMNPKKNHAAVGCEIECFLAYKDDQVVGRIAGIIVHKSNEVHDEKCIRFSRFDFIDDLEVASHLLNAVKNMGIRHGLKEIHGPWGFNDTDREGMLTFGFDRISTFATNYNFEYYPKIMQQLGFDKESEWVELEFDFKNINSKYTDIAKFAEQKNNLIDIAGTMSVKKIVKKYGGKFFDCYNETYKNLDNFIEITGEAKRNVLSLFATALNRKFISVIVDKETDKVIGFGIAMPSLGNIIKKHNGSAFLSAIGLLRTIAKPKALELVIIGVSPEYRKSGIAAVTISHIWQNIIKYNIQTVVSNPMLTTNSSVLNLWKFIPNKIIKRRQTFRANIDE